MKPGTLVKISDTGLLSAGYNPEEISIRHGVVIDNNPVSVVERGKGLCIKVLFNEDIELFYKQDLDEIKE
jgi:hypothetical protein